MAHIAAMLTASFVDHRCVVVSSPAACLCGAKVCLSIPSAGGDGMATEREERISSFADETSIHMLCDPRNEAHPPYTFC